MTIESISSTLTIAGITITLFLVTLLLGNLKKTRSNILLSLILVAFIPIFLAYGLGNLAHETRLFAILPFTAAALSVIGPLLFEYAFHFFHADQPPLFNNPKLYFPFFALGVLLVGAYLLLPITTYRYVLVFALSGSCLSLLYFLVKLVRYQLKSTQRLKLFYAKVSNKSLHWVNILIIGLFAALLLDAITAALISTAPFSGIPLLNTIFLLVLIWYLGYRGLSQERITDNIYQKPLQPTSESPTDLCGSKVYQDLAIQLRTVIAELELFKLEEVSLTVLARQLEVPPKRVSFVLNQCMRTSFYDLMNTYRLAAFKSEVERGAIKEKTILALAYEAGFNSKASFNRIFKQKEGVSPKQYVQSIRK